MNVAKTLNGSELTLTLSGRLDTTTAPKLEAELAATGDIDKLIFDFKELAYISSAGLRVLLLAQKQMNKKGGMLVRNVCDDILEVFEITGFSDILTIE